MTAKFFQNDYGHAIILTILEGDTSSAKDISTFSSKKIVAKKPSGDEVSFTAAFYTDGTDGKLVYLFAEDDLDEFGFWKFAARISKTGLKLSSTWTRIEIGEEIG